MPYNSINDPKLPYYIKKLSETLRRKWVEIFNSVYAKDGEKQAFIIANSWLSNRLEAQTVNKNAELLMTRAQGTLVKRADGNFTIDFLLTDDQRDSLGLRIAPALINKWAQQINSGLLRLFGDENHKEYDIVANSTLTPEEAIKVLHDTKKGFARSLKAFVKNGALWVRALVDKRALNILQKARGVSLEANLDIDPRTNTAVDGQLGGFTFATNSDPVNPRSKIVFGNKF